MYPIDERGGSSTANSRQPGAIVAKLLIVLALALGVFVVFRTRVRQQNVAGDGVTDQEVDSGERGQRTGDSKLESHRRLAAMKSATTQNGSRLFRSSLAIYHVDGDPLTARIGRAMVEQLRGERRFTEIQAVAHGERLADGELLPDVFVSLEKVSWEESETGGIRDYRGQIVVAASDQFRRSNHSYNSNTSPPRAQFRWRAEIDYTAKQTGAEASAARYEAVARDLAKEISSLLVKLLDDMAADYGRAGELPEQFYPAYVELPDFEFVRQLDAKKVVDGRQFMCPTVAYWVVEDHSPADVVAKVRRTLEDLDWKVPDEGELSSYLRATSGDQVIVVFPELDERGMDRESQESPSRMFVGFTRGMSLEDADAALRKAIEDRVDESILVMFQNWWYRHAELIEAYFRDQAPIEPDSWLQLARLRKLSDPDAARLALRYAAGLHMILKQESPWTSMKKLAEELGIDELPRWLAREDIQGLGLAQLDQPATIRLAVRGQRPVPVWLGDDSERQQWLILTVAPGYAPDEDVTLRVQLLSLQAEGGWSCSEQSRPVTLQRDRPIHTQQLAEGQVVETFAEPSEDGQHWSLTIERKVR